jgi:hypothetical protein
MSNKNKEIYDAILNIDSTAKVIVTGNTLDTVVIDWLEETTPISKSNIETKMAELQTAYDALAYARNRAKEYPSIADQLEDIYHNGIDAWKATIKTTKDKYPKG